MMRTLISRPVPRSLAHYSPPAHVDRSHSGLPASAAEAREREADSLAERVMAMGVPPQRDVWQHSPDDRRRTRRAHRDIETDVVGSSSSGRPLDDHTREFFEPRFGHDFARVRIHAGGSRATEASALHAAAYTIGPDIVFA